MLDKNDAGLRPDSNEEMNKDNPQSAPSEQDSATVSMQGVSGKVITGKVKVKKVKSNKPLAEPESTEPSVPEKKESAQVDKKEETSKEESVSSTTRILESSPKPRKIKSGPTQVEVSKTRTPSEPQKAEVKEKEIIEPAQEPTPVRAEKKEVDAAEIQNEKMQTEAKTPPATKAEKTISKKPEVKASPKVEEKVEVKTEKQDKKVIPSVQPRKISSGNDLPRPRKIASAAEVREQAEKQKAEQKAKQAEETSKATSSSTPPVATGPRKISSGSDFPKPRKISSATADDSLAATARAFANRKTEKEKPKEQGPGQRTRFSGNRRNTSPQQGQRPPYQQNRNAAPGGFDKDKDEEEQKFQSAPRRKKTTKPEILNDPMVVRGQDGKNKFGQNRDQQKTRFRDFGAQGSGRRRKNDFYDDGLNDRLRRKNKNKEEEKKEYKTITHVSLPSTLTVREFAEAISKTSADVIMNLLKNGVLATANQEIDYDTASIIAAEYGIETDRVKEVELSEILFDDSEDDDAELVARPPVVVVMGHVDHGKTTLLDRIRSASVASGEAGGITQRIGAYMTDLDGRKITFLDTPGHEAFTTMRSRGAQATDIAILVVAADDGVMPQTIEAINHAKAANTEIIVAINKMDKAGANPERVKQELMQYELVPEEWGGSTIMVPISALNGDGVDDLLEMVLLTADVLELKADPNKQAKGIIIEAQLDKNRGPVVTLLVQRGTLHQGDTIVANTVVGNVRAMKNVNGRNNQPAGPSEPVEVLGLPDVPEAGSIFYVVEDEKVARQYAEERREELRDAHINRGTAVTLDNLFDKIEAGKLVDFNIIIKADIVGSVEAMRQSLERLTNDEVRINTVHAGAGAINESDLRLAEASGAVVIGFNVRPNNAVLEMAKDLGVDIKLYTVIYHAIEEMELAMKGMLAPVFEEVVLGHVEIRETYKVSSVGTIGGAYVLDGKVTRNSDIRVLRDDVIVYTGKLSSLRRFKDDVREVAAGYECGISVDKFNDIKVGDIIEVYTMQEIER